MKNFKVLFSLIGFLLVHFHTYSQQEIRVMNYNVLNFPMGNIANRQDSLKTIIDYLQPDLVLLQELRSEEGLNLILDESFNTNSNNYSSSEYVPLQSNPNSSFPLQQAIIYNTEVFGFKDEGIILTSYRDINSLVLYLNSEQLLNGDTTFIYVYTTHLKSSEGEANEAIRNEMAGALVDHLEELPENSYVIFGGDFNVYSSTESAYQTLLNSENHIPLFDPIDSPGNWHSSSYPDKSILTQSTRSSQIFGDGAGGGVDDRFDFILLSEAFFQGSELSYSEDSYKAFGNNGICYNSSILNCIPGNEIPSEMITTLYYMSDHLPVILDMDLNITLSQINQEKEKFFRLSTANPINGVTEISFNSKLRVEYYLINAQGKIIQSGINNGQSLKLSLQDLPSGLYLLNLRSGEFNELVKLIR